MSDHEPTLDYDDDVRLRPADLAGVLRDAADFARSGAGNVAIVSTPPGTGKTRKALEELASSGDGTILAQSHRSLDEKEEEAESLGLTARGRLRGILAVLGPDGKPACVHEQQLRPWADQGLRLRKLFCEGRCKHAGNYRRSGRPCPAYAQSVGAGPLFASYAHAGVLGPKGELPTDLFIDELPPLIRTMTVGVDDLLTLEHSRQAPELREWCKERVPFARIVAAAAGALLESDRFERDGKGYTLRVVGSDLRNALVTAAGDCEKLDAAVSRLVAANRLQPRAPSPAAGDILAGKATRSSYPRLDLDDLLLGLAREGVWPRRGEAACMAIGYPPAIEGVPRRLEVWLEHRTRSFDAWSDEDGQPLSRVILDATAPLLLGSIEAALPGSRVRVFPFDVAELKGAVTREYYQTSSLTRRNLFGEGGGYRLRRSSDEAVAGLVMKVGTLVGQGAEVGIVTHRPLALLLQDALRALQDESASAKVIEERGCRCTLASLAQLCTRVSLTPERVLWFGGQRGSNALATYALVAVLGDPWPDIGAAREDARALGVGGTRHAEALRDAETAQALGRGREVRRTEANPLTLLFAGRDRPVCWHNVRVVELPSPDGGPRPSFASMLAEEVARQMLEHWGIASPALARLCGTVPAIVSTLNGAATLIEGTSYRSCGGIRAEDIQAICALPSRTLEAAFHRAIGGAPVLMRASPVGRGRWHLSVKDPAAAERTIDLIVRALAEQHR